jgi:hypothetical protein
MSTRKATLFVRPVRTLFSFTRRVSSTTRNKSGGKGLLVGAGGPAATKYPGATFVPNTRGSKITFELDNRRIELSKNECIQFQDDKGNSITAKIDSFGDKNNAIERIFYKKYDANNKLITNGPTYCIALAKRPGKTVHANVIALGDWKTIQSIACPT